MVKRLGSDGNKQKFKRVELDSSESSSSLKLDSLLFPFYACICDYSNIRFTIISGDNKLIIYDKSKGDAIVSYDIDLGYRVDKGAFKKLVPKLSGIKVIISDLKISSPYYRHSKYSVLSPDDYKKLLSQDCLNLLNMFKRYKGVKLVDESNEVSFIYDNGKTYKCFFDFT